VTLARGVVAKPSMLFCDEPTSGLSATDAELCIAALRTLAKRLNVLTVVVIHQPRTEVVQLFDTLVLLTSNLGRMTYFGPMADAPAYMKGCGHSLPEDVNSTDWYLDLVTPGLAPDASGGLAEAFVARLKPGIEGLVELALATKAQTAVEMLQAAHRQAVAHGRPEKKEKNLVASEHPWLRSHAAPFDAQLRMLLWRKACMLVRDPVLLVLQVAMPLVFGVFLGLVFHGIGNQEFGIPTLQSIFIIMTMIGFQSVPLVPTWIEERLFMKLETSEKLYTESAHILAGFLTTSLLSLVGATCQALIIYFLCAFPAKHLPTTLGWIVLNFLFFDAIFQCFSAFTQSVEQAITYAMPLLVVTMLFNGLVVVKSAAPAYLLWRIFAISPTFYAMQSIMIEIASDAGEGGKIIVDSLGYEEGHNVQGIIVTVCLIVALRAVQVVALKRFNSLQR